MLQILILAVCFVVFGIGYCGKHLAKLAYKDEVKKANGEGFFAFMTLISLVLAAIAFFLGDAITVALSRVLP